MERMVDFVMAASQNGVYITKKNVAYILLV
jgi:hypothetical protein